MITRNVRCAPQIRRSTSSCIRRGFRRRSLSKIGRITKIVKMVEVEVEIDVYAKLEKLQNVFCKQSGNSENCRIRRCNMVIRGPRAYLSRTGLSKSTPREAPTEVGARP